MLEIIKKWRELEYEARKKLMEEIGKNDKIINTVQQNLNIPDETTSKIKEALISAEGIRKPNFFEAFFNLY